MRPGRRAGTAKTGGRQKGVPNKATAEVKAAAREYTTEAIETLADIMRKSDSDQARVSAADKILDRAYGKPTQPIAGDEDMPPIGITPLPDLSKLSRDQRAALRGILSAIAG